jgi:hypothetical protein
MSDEEVYGSDTKKMDKTFWITFVVVLVLVVAGIVVALWLMNRNNNEEFKKRRIIQQNKLREKYQLEKRNQEHKKQMQPSNKKQPIAKKIVDEKISQQIQENFKKIEALKKQQNVEREIEKFTLAKAESDKKTAENLKAAEDAKAAEIPKSILEQIYVSPTYENYDTKPSRLEASKAAPIEGINKNHVFVRNINPTSNSIRSSTRQNADVIRGDIKIAVDPLNPHFIGVRKPDDVQLYQGASKMLFGK